MRPAVLVCVGLAWGCRADVPDATYVCAATEDCPPGQTCAGGLCQRSPDVECTPRSCEDRNAECGQLDDGCGGTVECGTCAAPEECGVGGVPNVCDCEPVACTPAQCGIVPNGCGALIDCGGCDAPATCGGAGSDNACGCPAVDCSGRCGMIPDGCGGVADCGGCPTGETCGAGGPNVCATGTCTPQTCGDLDAECGSVSDGCGDVVDCGGCTSPETCGGGPTGGVPNRCGCTPQTCGDLGAECDPVVEACGTTLDCGSCSGGQECDGSNRCCTRVECDGAGLECGAAPDGCGGMLDCGTCSDGYGCASNACVCAADPREVNDGPATATALGSAASAVVVNDANLHRRADEDWYRMGPDSSVVVNMLSVRLQRVPASATYELAVFVQCSGPSSSEEIPCGPGSTGVMSPFDGGCVATSASGGASVEITLPCPFSAVYVRVRALTWGGVCSPYELSIMR